MNIAMGIKGIRKTLKDNNTNWHVTTRDTSIGFYSHDLSTILSLECFNNYTLIDVGGNVLCIEENK